MTEQFDTETGEVRTNGAHRPERTIVPPTYTPVTGRSLNDSLEHALAEIPVWITATKESGRANAKYATLKEILVVVRPILQRHRVRIRQGADRSWPCDEGGGMKGRLIPVYTDLIHAVTGEQERTIVEMPLTRLDPQAMGSAITYGKRYSLLAALGLATDEADDDGAAAMPRDVSEPVRESPQASEMKGEIDKIKEASELAAWGNKPATKTRINKLSESDATLVRQHYAAHGRKLLGE